MELQDVLRRRRMVRRYDADRGLAPEVLDRVLAAALRAPAAGGTEGRALLVLRTDADREAFWADCAPGGGDAWLTGMRTAPVLVLVLTDPGAYAARYARADKPGPDRDAATWSTPWPEVDAGMAAELLLLAAVDEGLGACLFGIPAAAHDRLRTRFAVPAGLRLVAAVSLGHRAPDEASRSSRPGPRRGLAQVAHDGRFGVAWGG
ncbi:nitroreductase family protein [Kineococcus gynurae]|uniref:Nitroreductase family protein n=1 Tax=Kineococcus gynurae TaxID=452979 RepID=A0ABV5LV26_9ACTN